MITKIPRSTLIAVAQSVVANRYRDETEDEKQRFVDAMFAAACRFVDSGRNPTESALIDIFSNACWDREAERRRKRDIFVRRVLNQTPAAHP